LGAAAGGLQALLILGGSVLFAVGEYAAGYKHANRFVTLKGSTALLVAELGGVLVVLGVLAVLGSVLARARAAVPATDEAPRGFTLEWATTSPPPPHNFDTIPEVRSAAPLADLVTVEGTA
jgi:cytochrome c oxidase subunit 1